MANKVLRKWQVSQNKTKLVSISTKSLCNRKELTPTTDYKPKRYKTKTQKPFKTQKSNHE
ncbi:hypothetical protein [Psychroflexus aestuariivivens]|uniref:hypothetical protein n=1 Tax=Psychroflexus aestuariivivens TaxID=1795040 RepID=UPI000FDC5D01|nr:hypothetical protein [Psychroflexus aestuariivivens]